MSAWRKPQAVLRSATTHLEVISALVTLVTASIVTIILVLVGNYALIIVQRTLGLYLQILMSVLLTMEDVIKTVTTLLAPTTVPATLDTCWMRTIMDAWV